jgi:hypothetical protein
MNFIPNMSNILKTSPEWPTSSLKATTNKFGTIFLYMEGRAPRKWLEVSDETT